MALWQLLIVAVMPTRVASDRVVSPPGLSFRQFLERAIRLGVGLFSDLNNRVHLCRTTLRINVSVVGYCF